MSRKEQQYTSLYGAYTHAGQWGAGDRAPAGLVIWRFIRPGERQVTYVIDAGGGFPREVSEREARMPPASSK